MNRGPENIAAAGGNVFVSSTDGTVAVIDTSSLAVTKYINVGSNPAQMVVADDILYVSNTGGFSATFDSTLSIIPLNTLTEAGRIVVGINPGSITTDNASNNNTLIQSTQEALQLLELNSQTSIICIPCIAHVIQLCLKQLLGQIKANPKNETTEREWSETEAQKVQAKERNGEIAHTLNKVNTPFVNL